MILRRAQCVADLIIISAEPDAMYLAQSTSHLTQQPVNHAQVGKRLSAAFVSRVVVDVSTGPAVSICLEQSILCEETHVIGLSCLLWIRCSGFDSKLVLGSSPLANVNNQVYGASSSMSRLYVHDHIQCMSQYCRLQPLLKAVLSDHAQLQFNLSSMVAIV